MNISSSALQIPCILAFTYCAHINWTAPNVSKNTERVPVKDIWEIWMTAGIAGIPVLKATFWAIALAEIGAILLNEGKITDQVGISEFVGARNASHFYLTNASIAALAIMLLSTWLRIVCYKTMSRQFTFEISFREKHKLVTDGPYSYVRHPSYSGMTLVYIALFLWHLSPGSWVIESGVLQSKPGLAYISIFAFFMVGLEIAVLLRIEKEDKMLKKNFGKEWEDWAKRTPYAIIPGVW